jgi:hypothetical protein
VLALTPREVTIAVGEGEAWFEMAARLGARLSRNGYAVEMVSLDEAAGLAEPGCAVCSWPRPSRRCSAPASCRSQTERRPAPACGGAPA